jgi:hypothetical protein
VSEEQVYHGLTIARTTFSKLFKIAIDYFGVVKKC